MLELCISHLYKNLKDGVRYIYVITPLPMHTSDIRIKIVHESKFPFSRDDVLREMNDPGKEEIVHWYLQQLLKIYAKDVIPELSDTFLVFDADALLLKPIDISENIMYYVEESNETENKYHRYMQRLCPSFIRSMKGMSGVVDFQVWKKNVWNEIIEKTLEHHNHKKPFWKIYLHEVNEIQGCSEYETYFHYYVNNYNCEIRKIENSISNKVSELESFTKEYDIVTFHKWLGPRV